MTYDLAQIIKAYDVRGTVPDQLNETVAGAIGRAFAQTLRSMGEDKGSIVVAHDMRETGPVLVEAFTNGVRAEGMNVVNAGLASTDMLYYASGVLDVPGAMFTASHNPAEYNGIKMCLAGAKPVGQDTGLGQIRELAEHILSQNEQMPALTGTIETREMIEGYAEYLHQLVDLTTIRPLKVVVDAGNGMGGLTVPAVLGTVKALSVVPLYFELDGSFPNHEANPLEPANLVDLQKEVVEQHADLGIAFDGDADRCFVIDAGGDPVSPSAITALVATRELAKHPGSMIIHNLITSSAVPEIVRENGGTPVRTRVGHSFIKAEMANTGAVFGGEHSAHYYFKDFWGADTGMLAALHVLAALGESDKPLAELGSEFERYVSSGEINSRVADQKAKLAEVKAHFANEPQDEMDGLTVSFTDGSWINLRPSNTEPLLRLNVEAPTAQRMAQLRDEVLSIVRIVR